MPRNMRNQYRFSTLNYQQRIVDAEKERLFSLMVQFIHDGAVQQSAEGIEAIAVLLTATDYYVAHHLIGYQGNKPLFYGEVVKVCRDSLLIFLQQAASCNDLRKLLIVPVFQQQPLWILAVDEDVSCQFYAGA